MEFNLYFSFDRYNYQFKCSREDMGNNFVKLTLFVQRVLYGLATASNYTLFQVSHKFKPKFVLKYVYNHPRLHFITTDDIKKGE